MQQGNFKKDIFVVIPAYNEEKAIGAVLSNLKKNDYNNIIVVDDGSKDNTYNIAKRYTPFVHKHIINRGLGGALSTGIKSAIIHGAKIIITFDADGQHTPDMIQKAAKPILDRKADFVIGSRLIKSKGMPAIRKIGNFGLNVITFFLFGVWTTDSQSGLRCFTRKAAKKLNIRTSRMEVSSEFIKEIGRNRLRFKEVPIKAIYTDYSQIKGQGHLNAFKIVFKLILRKLMR